MLLKDGRVSIHFRPEGLRIEVIDHEANLTFCQVELTAEQMANALSGLAYCQAKVEVGGLDKVGLRMEHETLEFPLPEGTKYRNVKEVAVEQVKYFCPDGWEADLWFSSQGSFFRLNGQEFARTTIRRWVPIVTEEE